MPALLERVDVWSILLSTPAGRALDDTHSGDPRYYSTTPNSAGWRGNGDTRGCAYGANVARNFSSGWAAAPSTDCVDDPGMSDPQANYRGFAPFSIEEAIALRTFVENHSISMAVVLHAPSQEIWNL